MTTEQQTETLDDVADRIAYKYLDRTFSSAKLKVDILSALRNERERLKNLIKLKRDGTMERYTGGYESEVYYLKYADVKEVCDELLQEIDQ